MFAATAARHDPGRARRRYQRALRKAGTQLARARRRTPGAARPIPSVDIVLALRRAERRRAAEAEVRRQREARRAAARLARTARLARALERLTGRSVSLPLGLAARSAGAADPRPPGRPRRLAALAASLAGHRAIG